MFFTKNGKLYENVKKHHPYINGNMQGILPMGKSSNYWIIWENMG